MAKNYDQYLNMYGKDKYAGLVQKGLSDPNYKWTDKNAAMSFKADNPGLFSTQTNQPNYSNLPQYGVGTPPAGTVPVRSYLTGKGYGNDQIKWDQPSGNVILGDKARLKPSAEIGGVSYAPSSVLDQALAGTGFQTPDQQRETKINSIVDQLTQKIGQPFTFDPNTDPSYQAAKTLTEANAKRAGNQAMAELNDRGILNSTITADRLGRINNEYITQGLASMVPGMEANAYSRYQGNLGNIQGLLGDLTSLQSANRQQQQADRAFNYQQQQDANTKAMQEAGLTGYYNGQLTPAARAQISGVTGIDPTTGKQTPKSILAQENFDLNNLYKMGMLGVNQQRANDTNTRFYSGLDAKQKALTEKNMQNIIKTADSYFDKLPTNPKTKTVTGKYGKKSEVQVAPGVGEATKAELKSQFRNEFNYYLEQDDPYGTFQSRKEEYQTSMPDTANYLINALQNALSPMGKQMPLPQ